MNLIRGFISKNLIFIIIGFYFVICMTGLFYDFSLDTVGDDSVLMNTALKMINDHTLRPNYESLYHFPFAVYIYLPIILIFLIFLRFSGLFGSLAEIKEFVILDSAKLIPLARFINVLIGALSIYLVYLIANKLFANKKIAWLSAYLFAMSMSFIQISHTAVIWVPQIMTILLSLYFVVLMYDKEKLKIKDYLINAFFIVLSFGVHFIGLLSYIPFLVVHYFKDQNKSWLRKFILNRNLWLANLVIILFIPFLYYLNPHGFLNYTGGLVPKLNFIAPIAYNTVSENISTQNNGNNILDLLEKESFFAKWLTRYDPLLMLLFLPGVIYLFLKKGRIFYLLFSFILIYYLGMNLIGNKIKYISPLIPFISIITAYGLISFYDSKLLSKPVKFIILTVIVIFTAYAPVLYSYKLSLPNPSLEARDWIYKNIKTGSNLISLDQTMYLNESKDAIADYKEWMPSYYLTKHKYLETLDNESYPSPNYYIFYPMNFFRTLPADNLPPKEILIKKYDYLILSNGNNYYYKNEYDDKMAIFNEVNKQKLELIKKFPLDKNSSVVNIYFWGWTWDLKEGWLPKFKLDGPREIYIYKIL